MKINSSLKNIVVALFLTPLLWRGAGGEAFAQLRGINYQAVAIDENGKEIVGMDLSGQAINNKTIGIRFSILSGTSTGPLLYQETHTTNTDQYGLFSLIIGDGSVSTSGLYQLLIDIPWSAANQFLKVEIAIKNDGDYKLMSIQQLMAVPYSFYALKSDTAQYSFNSGTSGAPSTNWKLTGNDSTIAGTNFIGTTDSVDFVVKTNNTEKMRLTTGGTIGIGTASPVGKFHIHNDAVGNDSSFVVLKNGNVGIGTTTPSGSGLRMGGGTVYGKILDLQTNDLNAVRLLNTSFDFSSGIFQEYGHTQNDGLFFGSFGTTSNHDASIKTNNIERVTVKNTGNVGIGTLTPAYKLDVSSSDGVGLRVITTNGTWSGIQIGNSSVTPRWNMYQFGTGTGVPGDFSIYEDGLDARLLIQDGTGNVGIGTATPASKLDVEGGISVGINYSGTTAAPANGAIIEGNVGIGTSAPTARLEVVGQVKITDGTEGSGKVLTSNAAGLATWAIPDTGTVTTITGTSPISATTTDGGVTYTIAADSNTQSTSGVVSAGGANINTVWKTDAAGNPAWRADSTTAYSAGTGLTLSGTTFNSVWTQSADTIYNNNTGNVGIGATNPGARLDVKGSGSTNASYGLGVRNSADAYAMVVRDDGNVGIGTYLPIYQLESWKDLPGADFIGLSVANGSGNNNSDVSILLRGNLFGGTSNRNLFMKFRPNPNGFDPGWYAGYDGTNAHYALGQLNGTGVVQTPLFVIQADGNVGIGTTNPSGKLELGSGQLLVPLGSVSVPSYTFQGDTNTGIYSSGADDISFSAKGSRTFRVQWCPGCASWAVGLGTQTRFYTTGNLEAGGGWMDSQASNTRFMPAGGDAAVYFGSSSTPISLVTSANANMRFASISGVGQYASPGDGLGSFIWETGSAERMRLTSAGNVGIGTTTPDPSALLDVSSGNKGVLLPRVALTSTNDITTIAGAVTSLLVYNTDTSGVPPNKVMPGYYYWNGTKWLSMSGGNWSLIGNAGTVDSTDFIGTLDNTPFNIRVNNQKAGRIDPTLSNTFWGYLTGNANTTGSNNTANGGYALYSNTTGNDNTAKGYLALYSNTTGSDNTANGLYALRFNTTGFQNTANGGYALYSNNTGKNNTAHGYKALYSNTTGSYNTAIGDSALLSNTIGIYNTATGVDALYSNTLGNYNTAMGAGALNENTIGQYNTATGAGALFFNTVGQYNTANGYGALYDNTIGTFNTANGSGALNDNTIGAQNTATGAGALQKNTIGSNNTADGTGALFSNILGIYNTATGNAALYSNISNNNTAYGGEALNANTTGYQNTANGRNALKNNITGMNNTALGYNAFDTGTAFSNSTALGYNAQITASNTIQLGDTNITDVKTSGTITGNGFITAFSTKSANYTLTATDDIVSVTGTTTITLPTAAGIAGRKYTIKNTDPATTVTVDANAGETIDGTLTKLLTVLFQYITVVSDGTKWLIVAGN